MACSLAEVLMVVTVNIIVCTIIIYIIPHVILKIIIVNFLDVFSKKCQFCPRLML